MPLPKYIVRLTDEERTQLEDLSHTGKRAASMLIHARTPVSDAELKVLAAMISANPGIRVRINGHTDDVGGIEDNLQLSLKRANAVINRLIGFGVSSKVLSAKGFGESVPVGDNTTEAGRKANRRIEFEILP